MEYKIVEQEIKGVTFRRKYADQFIVTEVEPDFNEPQESMYAVVLSSLISDKRFTPAEKIVILEISALSRRNGYCYATKGYIAKATDTSFRTIENTLRKMEEYGMAERIFTNKLVDKDGKEHTGTFQRIYWKQQPFEGGVSQNYQGGFGKKVLGGVGEIYQDKTEYNKQSITTDIYVHSFNEFWELYPKKVGKKKSEEIYKKKATGKREEKEIMEGLGKYLKKWRGERTDIKYIPNPVTWLNQERWTDEVVISNEQYNQNAREFEERMGRIKEQEKREYSSYLVDNGNGGLVKLSDLIK